MARDPRPAAARPSLARRSLLMAALTVLVLAAALVGAGQAGLLQGTPPADLGVQDGRLKPPSMTANSVSSQARLHAGHPMAEAAQIEPLPLPGRNPAEVAAAMQRLRAVLLAQPGATLAAEQPGYLRVQFRTRWLGFVDDAEFWADVQAGVIQLRSASRLGQRDLGVNRARIEAIRAVLAAGG